MRQSSSHSSLKTRQLHSNFPVRSYRILSTRRDPAYRSPSPIEVAPTPGPSRTRNRSPSIESSAPRPYTRRRINRIDSPVIIISSDEDEPSVPPSAAPSSRVPSSQASRAPSPNIDDLGAALPDDLRSISDESDVDLPSDDDDAVSVNSSVDRNSQAPDDYVNVLMSMADWTRARQEISENRIFTDPQNPRTSIQNPDWQSVDQCARDAAEFCTTGLNKHMPDRQYVMDLSGYGHNENAPRMFFNFHI